MLKRRALLGGAGGLIAGSAQACPSDGPRRDWLGNLLWPEAQAAYGGPAGARVTAPNFSFSHPRLSAGTTTSAPAPAAAVGYNSRTYGPNVTLGTNWFPAPNSNVVQNSDGSATDLGGVPNHYNSHVASCRGTTGWESGNIVGCVFDGGCYAEWTFSWANPPVSSYSNTDGWPALWSWSGGNGMFNGLPTMPGEQVCEVDAYEAYYPEHSAAFNTAPIHWYPRGRYGSDNGQAFGPSGFGTTRSKLGMLWVPATATSQGYIKTYANGVQVGRTYSWNRYGGGTIPNQVGGSNDPAWSTIDFDGGRRFLWGTGTKNPLTIYAFEVWQASGAKNKGTLA